MIAKLGQLLRGKLFFLLSDCMIRSNREKSTKKEQFDNNLTSRLAEI